MKKIIPVLVAAILMPLLLILSALIPKESIKQNTLESAEYLFEGELFGHAKEGVEGSIIDRYADAILLNIAYHFDKEVPLESVMVSAYYFTPNHEENENLLIAVRDDMGINQQYLRYWHGSIAFVRPLLTIFSIREIYIINAVILIALLAVFIVMSVRIREYPLIIAIIISLIITRSWYVPLSLEYTWTFMLMFICAITAVILQRKGMREYYCTFFVITGMITSFVDFLTTETITLLIPLLVILWIDRERSGNTINSPHPEKTKQRTEKGDETDAGAKKNTVLSSFVKREDVKMAICCVFSWLAGYVGMWASKWILCSLIMKENAFPYVMGHVGERLGGNIGLGIGEYITGAIVNNVGCLFPLGYGSLGVVIFIIMILAALYIAYVYRRGKSDMNLVLLMALIGLIPYIRYVVLHNHSYIHAFFTYRAQMATVMAIVLIVVLVTEKKDG
ncbi:MAG: hypothetical protein K6B28_12185 [Lachnospiraceae bacterium]|nr:hypothetical protein [Lachnospiraceae bacterium]